MLKSIVPFTKEISFGSKIAEITSMSLEHELNVEVGELKGNFIISGDYKSHEISVNREPFLYKLPFSMDLTDGIDIDSIAFEITDFAYELKDEDTVIVNIEFSIEAEEKVEEDKEERSIFEKVDSITNDEELVDLVETEEVREPKEVKIIEKTTKTESLKESEETIIKNVNPTDDSFATYHIHIVKDGENVETICTMYHSNLNLLSDYNDMSNISVGDKIIIPKEDE